MIADSRKKLLPRAHHVTLLLMIVFVAGLPMRAQTPNPADVFRDLDSATSGIAHQELTAADRATYLARLPVDTSHITNGRLYTAILGDASAPLCKSVGTAGNNCRVEIALLKPEESSVAVLIDGYLVINPAVLENDQTHTYVVNGIPVEKGKFTFDVSSPNLVLHVERYEKEPGCRRYSSADSGDFAYDATYLTPSRSASQSSISNGIVIRDHKIFDTQTLRRMLTDTASQLASISGFNSAPIVAAYGNLQGVTRDTSYLTAQVTTTPTPTVSSTESNSLAGNNGLNSVATLPLSPATSTLNVSCPNGTVPQLSATGAPNCVPAGGTTTITCPPGTYPTLSAANAPACTLLPSGSTLNSSTATVETPEAGSSSAIATSVNNPGASLSNTLSNSLATNQQSGATVTSGGVAGAVPIAPASTALTPPSNVGLSASDVLSEQVQLNSQLTVLRLLLQGSLTDRYLASNARAVAQRGQSTLGFTVSLDPPRGYKHAVAEVRVLIASNTRDTVSIMNLLPSEKTYNVAKVTSNQKAFGAGVAIEALSIGVATGKSKDRLYLAKDTDTVALQFDDLAKSSANPKQGLISELRDWVHGVRNDGACDYPTVDKQHGVLFGWQFRPVLGADYVEPGNRQVFAQLALPVGSNENFEASIKVQTVWRYYDPQQRVVGPVIPNTCSDVEDSSAVALLSPLKVHSLEVTDIGGGQLRLSAKGNFYSPVMTVRTGSNNVIPTMFNGETVDVFGAAKDLLKFGKLTLIDANGRQIDYGTQTGDRKTCGFENASMVAVPFSDGNSRVQLDIVMNKDYQETDGQIKPFAAIGDQVYGLQESPYSLLTGIQFCSSGMYLPDADSRVQCRFEFIASTASLQKAQTFFVRDLTWAGNDFQKSGAIDFEPGFSGLSTLGTVEQPTSATGGAAAGGNASASKDKPKPDTVYALSGFGFHYFDPKCGTDPTANPCPTIFFGSANPKLSEILFQRRSDNLVTIQVHPVDGAKTLRVEWAPRHAVQPSPAGQTGLPLAWVFKIPTKEPATKPTASPAILYSGDSETVTFNGGDLKSITGVTFEGLALKSKYDGDSDTLTVSVPTKVTEKPGHKELVGATAAADKTVALPIDVVRR